MFAWVKRLFKSKDKKMEEDLVDCTIMMLGLLSDLRKQNRITENVYQAEIEKKVAFLKSLNKSYESILNQKEEVNV